MKTAFLLFSVILIQLNTALAQTNECATDYFHNKMMQEDTAYRNQIIALEAQVAAILQSKPTEKSQNAVYTIPIVQCH